MAKEIEDQLPVKPVGLFSEVTAHRTGKEMTEEKKYEIKDDGNFNFTGEHQLDDTEDINSTNINDSDGRSISQNQNGRQYQDQHTACSWAYNNQTSTLLPSASVFHFIKYGLVGLLSNIINTVSSSR